MKPLKIALANFSKMVGDTGGFAKVFSAFANEMTRRGHQVTMIYSDDRQGEFFYPVADDVRVYNLRYCNGTKILFPTWMKIKRELLRAIDTRKGRGVNDEFHGKYLLSNLKTILKETLPDIIVSFHPMASKIIICDLKTDIPVITMSHGDPEDYFHTYPVEEIPAIERSTANQVLLPSFVKPLRQRYPHLRVEVIGNVVPQYEEPADLAAPKSRYKILFVGRLVRGHKQPHLLVEAFCRLADEFPQWDVELWGADDKVSFTKSMQRKIDQAGLHDRIVFKGTTRDVASVLRQGDIFAFPSAYEGWGLSLTEAMSMGLPAVGLQSCVAVNEIIKDGETGILTSDGATAYAEGLRTLMENVDARKRMGAAARESMRPYSAEAIWGKWEALLKDCVAV